MEQNTTFGGTTGYAQQNDPQRSSASSVMDSIKDSATGVLDRAKESASGVMDKARHAMQREPMSMPRPEHREGPVARAIEQQTARIPSDAFLWAAVGSIGLSLALELSGKEKTANFVGHWAPTLLILGLYNKMVKLQGSDGI
ncbi:MAG: hypothetical protein SGI92_23320 [Bryobacteraceae bacterium]|nr:hypothetical protein [Bryobacteraceae bacterium]